MLAKSILAAAIAGATLFAAPRASAQSLGPDARLFNDVRVRGAYVGVGIVDIDADRAGRLKMTEERGVEVTNIEEGGPADAAGIKPGDVLLTYNGENILGTQQFIRLVRETPAGRKVRLSIWRNGKEQSVTVTTGTPHSLLQTQSMENALNSGNGPYFPTSMIITEIPRVMMLWDTPTIGLVCEPLEAQLAQYFGVTQGVLVRAVGQGSAAEKAGFKAGDVLTSAGNHPVRTTDDFRRVLRSSTKQVPVSVTRDHKELTLSLSPMSDRED